MTETEKDTWINEEIQKGTDILKSTKLNYEGNLVVDLNSFQSWKVCCLNLLADIAGEEGVFSQQFKKDVVDPSKQSTEKGINILNTVRIELQNGRLNKQPLAQVLKVDSLFPMEIFQGTRKKYIEKIAVQANGCYEQGFYDACAVMVRRLVETLIIECFESNKITEKIKSSDGHFVSLEHLIKKFLEEDWNPSRNGKKDLKKLPELKCLGDISAHNRYYLATKSDIDQVKSHTRLIIQELFTISQGV